MKKLIYLLALVACFAACNNSTKQKAVQQDSVVLTVDQIQEKGDDLVGKTVVIIGTVSHVCKHSGKRCFLMGSNEDITIKVEAGNRIGSFSQEQMGSDLKISGILQEIRIDENYVAEMEAEVEEEGHAHEANAGDQCTDELHKIAELRKEIAASKKGYLSIFYMDGEKIIKTN